MYRHTSIDLLGTMPDNVYPSAVKLQNEKLDYVFIYFRNDGNLYLYDTLRSTEFNLYTIPADSRYFDFTLNPFGI